jgi:hypothetical protein
MHSARYELDVETEGDYLQARPTGDRMLDTVTAMTIEVAKAASAARAGMVLIDVRELRGRLRLVDSHLVVNAAFDAFCSKGLR